MNEALFVAIIRNDLETALFETGDLLKDGATDVLENTWIRVLALVGETVGLGNIGEYQASIMEVDRITADESDEVDVADAFLITTRIAFLCNRFDNFYARPVLAKMKEKVQGLFPESGSLNDKGMATYRRLLPTGEEERAFIVRILAGLAKIWSEEDYDNARLVIEYLTRKRFVVPKPKWIMPAAVDDNDIIWILWGAITLFAPDSIVIATSFKIFCRNYKKQSKIDRAGLLWASFYHMSCSYKKGTADIWWTPEEKRIYNHVSTNVRALWNQIVPPVVATNKQSKNIKDKDVAVWAEYFPRGAVCTVIDIPPLKEESRTLKIKEPKVSTKHETGDIDTRDWRLYPCE